jgi:hypothetical protein
MRGIALGVLGCVVVLSACTSSPDGVAGGGDPARLAPRPPIELDVSRFAGEPCAMLGAKQAIADEVTAGAATGKTCTWRTKNDQRPSYTATVEPTSSGLEQLYRRRTEFRMFEPTVITGFPAVFTDPGQTTADHGHCTVIIGVADDSAITVTSTVTDPKSFEYHDPAPCNDAENFARALVGNIKSGNP